MNGLKLAHVEMDRKALSNLAIEDKEAFQALVARAKDALKA
jgi:large subunit ribosomal protein L20